MKVDICMIKSGYTLPVYMGSAEVEKFDVEELFHLCNWANWSDTKPENLQCDISSIGRGLVLIDPETKQKWLSKTKGWLVCDNVYEVMDYVEAHKDSAVWL